MNIIKFSALTSLLATTASTATAADLSRVFAPSAPVFRESRGNDLGWYLRGEIGYVDYKRPEADFSSLSSAGSLTHESLSNAAVAGFGLGYRFNANVRADITLDHNFNARFKGIAPTPAFATTSMMDRGTFQSSTLMINGYLDFRPVMGFMPYVGAGIGVAKNVLSNAARITYDSVTGVETWEAIAGGDDYRFAWALMAGVGYQLSSNFTLDLGYRYISLGDVKTRSYATGNGTDVESIGAHEVRFGVRYSFN